VLDNVATALPEAGMLPPPGDSVTEVTPVTFHDKVELPPELMLVGLAVKEMIAGREAGAGGAAAATTTVTDLVAVPPGPSAVRVKVVVEGGRTAA